MSNPISHSHEPIVTLKDESKVPESLYISTIRGIQEALVNNTTAFYHLFQKCLDSSYQFEAVQEGDPTEILKKHALITEHGDLDGRVKSIVMNAIEDNGKTLHYVSPIKKG